MRTSQGAESYAHLTLEQCRIIAQSNHFSIKNRSKTQLAELFADAQLPVPSSNDIVTMEDEIERKEQESRKRFKQQMALPSNTSEDTEDSPEEDPPRNEAADKAVVNDINTITSAHDQLLAMLRGTKPATNAKSKKELKTPPPAPVASSITPSNLHLPSPPIDDLDDSANPRGVLEDSVQSDIAKGNVFVPLVRLLRTHLCAVTSGEALGTRAIRLREGDNHVIQWEYLPSSQKPKRTVTSFHDFIEGIVGTLLVEVLKLGQTARAMDIIHFVVRANDICRERGFEAALEYGESVRQARALKGSPLARLHVELNATMVARYPMISNIRQGGRHVNMSVNTGLGPSYCSSNIASQATGDSTTPICRRYNKGTCNPPCVYRHICSSPTCIAQKHPYHLCPNRTNNTSNNNQSGTREQQAGLRNTSRKTNQLAASNNASDAIHRLA